MACCSRHYPVTTVPQRAGAATKEGQKDKPPMNAENADQRPESSLICILCIDPRLF
jgi:hypothetical protein